MNKRSEKTIFFDALELDDPAERERFLDQACEDNQLLRKSVEALLQASGKSDNPLDRPPVSLPAASQVKSADDLIGTMIGPYRLMEQIGEGGFGLVFVAHQEKPVRRNVALKIVKPGTGSKEIIARFEAERQAVAMMDHPNIARVFDAGVTADARPFFVMELVRGVPITEFADSHRLTIRERLRLFSDVCSAVHHAHQKGVIHRDIKPSNVMVTLHDDRPVVKVIDFGVAKAIGQTLTDKTIYTRFFSMIGTPLYMSPEQAEMSGLDVDTRSDIYSLGVVLYELLAGTTPFDRDRLDSAGLDEMRRIIREEEPPRPSRRLSTLGARMTTISESRRAEPNRLTSSLRGDLDWIVMKSLEKDRNRRYDSAAALAIDINRFLEQQPIEARPPRWSYLLVKFARRNRIALATGSAILLTMFLGMAASLWQMNQAISERDQKESALQEIELFATKVTQANALVASAQTHADSNQLQFARADFNAAVSQQPSYYLPWVSRAQFFTSLKFWDEAANDYTEAIRLGAPTDTPQWWGVPALLQLTDNQDAYRYFMTRVEQKLNDKKSIGDWEWLRNCLADDRSLSADSYAAIAELAETWLSRMGGPPPGGFGPRFGPPPRRHDRREPEREFNETSRDRPGRREQIRDLPRPVAEYITGLAHLRAGNFDLAIDQLRRSANSDWPSRGLADTALAIAFHKTDRKEDAAAYLELAQTALDLLPEEMQVRDRARPAQPWFDDVEMIVLYREATRLIDGNEFDAGPLMDKLRL